MRDHFRTRYHPGYLVLASQPSFICFLVVCLGVDVVTARAHSTDRALALGTNGYVDFGDPGEAFDLVPGGANLLQPVVALHRPWVGWAPCWVRS